jgi:hypothetical protein
MNCLEFIKKGGMIVPSSASRLIEVLPRDHKGESHAFSYAAMIRSHIAFAVSSTV